MQRVTLALALWLPGVALADYVAMREYDGLNCISSQQGCRWTSVDGAYSSCTENEPSSECGVAAATWWAYTAYKGYCANVHNSDVDDTEYGCNGREDCDADDTCVAYEAATATSTDATCTRNPEAVSGTGDDEGSTCFVKTKAGSDMSSLSAQHCDDCSGSGSSCEEFDTATCNSCVNYDWGGGEKESVYYECFSVENTCLEYTLVQRDLCVWHDIPGMGSDECGLDNCRVACDNDPDCFAIQWVKGEPWCNTCTGWGDPQNVGSMNDWAATSGDARVQSKACWAADAVKRCAVDASSAVGVSVLALLAALAFSG